MFLILETVYKLEYKIYVIFLQLPACSKILQRNVKDKLILMYLSMKGISVTDFGHEVLNQTCFRQILLYMTCSFSL